MWKYAGNMKEYVENMKKYVALGLGRAKHKAHNEVRVFRYTFLPI